MLLAKLHWLELMSTTSVQLLAALYSCWQLSEHQECHQLLDIDCSVIVNKLYTSLAQTRSAVPIH